MSRAAFGQVYREPSSSGGTPPVVQFTRTDVFTIPGDRTEVVVEFDAQGAEAGNPPQYDPEGLRSTVSHSYALLTQPIGSAVDITADTEGMWLVGGSAEFADTAAVDSSSHQMAIYVNDDAIDDTYKDDDWDGTQPHILSAETLGFVPVLRELHDGDSVWMAVNAVATAPTTDVEVSDCVLTMVWIRPLLPFVS